jgi:hypothetical protein
MSVLNEQQGDQPSTTQTAKQEAAGVAGRAKEAAGGVVSTSTEQAKEVVGEAQRQARDLAGEARQQLRSQTTQQRQKAVSSLHGLGDELNQMAEGSQQSGVGTELARQASRRVHDVASYLETHEPGDLLDEVRAFARRRPGAFLATAAAAGVVVGRLTRGAVAARREESGQTGMSSDQYGIAGSSTYALPTPPPPVLPPTEYPPAPTAGVTASPAGLEPGSDVTAPTTTGLQPGPGVTAAGGTRPVPDPGSALEPDLGERDPGERRGRP